MESNCYGRQRHLGKKDTVCSVLVMRTEGLRWELGPRHVSSLGADGGQAFLPIQHQCLLIHELWEDQEELEKGRWYNQCCWWRRLTLLRFGILLDKVKEWVWRGWEGVWVRDVGDVSLIQPGAGDTSPAWVWHRWREGRKRSRCKRHLTWGLGEGL